MNIRSLSDLAVLEGLTVRVKTERKSMTEVLEFLREVDRRRLYAESGHASLWEFCTKVHGYSSGAAARRIQAMRLVRDLPELKEDLAIGLPQSQPQLRPALATNARRAVEKLSKTNRTVLPALGLAP